MNHARCGLAVLSLTMMGVAPLLAQDQSSRYDCVIEPSAVVKVGSRSSGLLADLHVDRGDSVVAGAVIAELESGIQQAEYALAKIRAKSQVEVDSAKARLAYQDARLERQLELLARTVVASVVVDEVKTERELAQQGLNEAALNHELRKVELKRAQEALDMRQVLSPVKGIVTEREMSAGEYVYEQSTILTIATVDPLYVEVFIPTRDYTKVKALTTGRVYPAAPIGGELQARIAVIDNVFDAASESFGVRLELPNPKNEVPAGLRCEVQFDFPAG